MTKPRRTSLTHPLQIAHVRPSAGVGRIGVTFCPGKIDPHAMTGGWARDLTVDLDAVAKWGAAAVVTLVEAQELAALKVPTLGAEVERRHMDWLHLPIQDVSTPSTDFEAAWTQAGAGLRARLRDGADILIHCKGGLGRAGTIAARLLVELGSDADAATAAIRAVRPGAIETRAQEAFVRDRRPLAEPRPATDAPSMRDRAIGALVGLAVGDAVGTTLEFIPRNDTAPRLPDMVGGGPFRLVPGGWTDDTSMSLALADSLLASPDLDVGDLMHRFISWWQGGAYSHTGRCFDIGTTTQQALSRFLKTGDPLAGSTDPYSAGNGSLMRLAPVAIRHVHDTDQRRSAAALQSRSTHAAVEAVDACVFFADLIAEAIAGRPRSEILAPRPFEGAPKIAAIAAGSWRGKPRADIRGSGYVVEALEAALWCVGRTADFKSAVLLAANLRDDADTTAAITGQLAGAHYGWSGIPEAWRERLAWGPRIREVGQSLFDAAQVP